MNITNLADHEIDQDVAALALGWGVVHATIAPLDEIAPLVPDRDIPDVEDVRALIRRAVALGIDPEVALVQQKILGICEFIFGDQPEWADD